MAPFLLLRMLYRFRRLATLYVVAETLYKLYRRQQRRPHM
jgi:hypothetical protein